MNSSTSVSSCCAGSAPGSSRSAADSSRRRRAWSLRYWSVSRRTAVWMSQPRGLSGSPSAGQCIAAASSASCTASSAASKSP
jgi:hypothetical protein